MLTLVFRLFPKSFRFGLQISNIMIIRPALVILSAIRSTVKKFGYSIWLAHSQCRSFVSYRLGGLWIRTVQCRLTVAPLSVMQKDIHRYRDGEEGETGGTLQP